MLKTAAELTAADNNAQIEVAGLRGALYLAGTVRRGKNKDKLEIVVLGRHIGRKGMKQVYLAPTDEVRFV